MDVETMLKVLGVRTQSKESIELCYKMDIEAFNMMSSDDNNYSNEKFVYECVYKSLLDELDYEKLSTEEKVRCLKVVDSIDLNEEDKEYRDLYFTGLERVLLRYGRYDLIKFQRIPMSDHDGIAKDAYLYELHGDYATAIKYYNLIGEDNRYDICIYKSSR
ncbi:MAG: hypothetical protein IKP77_07030 [Acholeplasmatales bacterium]|nr:hypothetical protein [Acholeplasmatales bacterium]